MALEQGIVRARQHRLGVAARPHLLRGARSSAAATGRTPAGSREGSCGRGLAPVGERLVAPGRPRRAELAAELVVDEVAELVQEAERDPAVPARDAEVDGVTLPQPVSSRSGSSSTSAAPGPARGRSGGGGARPRPRAPAPAPGRAGSGAAAATASGAGAAAAHRRSRLTASRVTCGGGASARSYGAGRTRPIQRRCGSR